MSFVEPKANQFSVVAPPELLPDFSSVDRAEVIELCRVWDARGLLNVLPRSYGPHHLWMFSKVFNNFKNPTSDRQIGDRRGQNFCEGHIEGGTSRSLPTASTLLQLGATRFSEALVGSIADRRYFYHQFWTTDERCATNALYPPLSLSEIAGTHAAVAYANNFLYNKQRRKKGFDRILEGDFLGGDRRGLLFEAQEDICYCFAALFQGDHLGVEFATDAHSRLLQESGLLSEGCRLQSDAPLIWDGCASGLVIDDFFVIS